MTRMALSEAPNHCGSGGAEIMKMAERELAAFFNAVKQLFGAGQAQLAADDWLQELESTSPVPVAIREWRMITIKAARRLAIRLNPSFQHE